MSSPSAKAKRSDNSGPAGGARTPAPQGGVQTSGGPTAQLRPGASGKENQDKASSPPRASGGPQDKPAAPQSQSQVYAAAPTGATQVAPFEADDSEEEEEPEDAEADSPGHTTPQKSRLSASQELEERLLQEQIGELVNDGTPNSLLKTLSSLTSWKSRYPEDELGRNTVCITHDFDTYNRILDGALSTDVFPVDGTVKQINVNNTEKHTRLCEAIGHYCPNLLRVLDGNPVSLHPQWVPLTGKPSAFRLTDGKAPPQKGWVRYRLVNGKHGEVRSKQTGPPFVIFPPTEELLGFACFAIRQGLSEEEYSNVTTKPLLTQGELFDAAVDFAGGVEQVKLLTYFHPSESSLPDSRHIREWLRVNSPEEPAIRLPPMQDPREALLRTIDSLSSAQLTTAGGEALELLKTIIHPGLTPESASTIYSIAAAALGDSDESAFNGPTPIKMWATPSADPTEAEVTDQVVDFHINGESCPAIVEVYEDCEYDVPFPAFLAPEGASTSAISVLSYYTSLRERIEVQHGTFSERFPWYALSITPRKQFAERGILSDGPTWFERMSAQVDYTGPIFNPRDANDIEALNWADAFNTTWMEEVLLLGTTRTCPRVFLWPGAPLQPPLLRVPAAARGIGVVDGRLTLTPLLQCREDWEKDARRDSRLRFPLEVLRAVINHPEVFEVVDAEEYLALRASLQIRATINGETATSFFYPGMKLRADASSVKDAFVHSAAPQSVDESEGGVRLPLRTVPPRSKKVEETTDQEWGIPSDDSAPGWQLKPVGVKKPHSQVPAYSAKVTIKKIGNWDTIGDQLKRAGLTEELIQQLYSVHWQAANSTREHPVIQYHHPSWTDSLKGKPINRRRWRWPTGAIAPCPWLSTNDAGQLPLFGSEAETHLRKQAQKETSTVWYFQQNQRGTDAQLNAVHRHVPRRGRGGQTQPTTTRNVPPAGANALSTEANPPPTDDVDQSAWW